MRVGGDTNIRPELGLKGRWELELIEVSGCKT
jgi:hypothetical protein